MSEIISRYYIFVSISVVVHIFGLPIRHKQTLTAVERHQSKGNLENEPAGGLLCDFVCFVQITGNVVIAVNERRTLPEVV